MKWFTDRKEAMAQKRAEEDILAFMRAQETDEDGGPESGDEGERDALFREAAEACIQNQGGSTRQRYLRQADAALNKLRLYLRLAHRWHWLNDGQYQHVSSMVAELGRLLGGWMKAT